MTEEFLHYIWKYRLYDQAKLTTSAGESLQIIKTGEHNTDSGPDFFNARIKVGKTLWAGNVEVHLNASDWKKHRHQDDRAYDSIILHVVYEEDEPLFRRNGEPLPTFTLRERIPNVILSNYLIFKASKDWVPCEKQLHAADMFTVNNWLDRLLAERLESKSGAIGRSLLANTNNWEETFYQQLARSFGFKVNADPFELLARSLPASILARHKNNLFQLEALFFGQAGMLERSFNDKYPEALQNEYQFLKGKFSINPVDEHLWKFMRLRPSNFPTIRISQFAALVNLSSHLFSKVLRLEDPKALRKIMDVNVSEYWLDHYQFDKISVKKQKKVGDDAIDHIMINTVVPFLFLYGKQRNEEKYMRRALRFLEATRAETNSIISKWGLLGINAENAFHSQALLQLKSAYCDKKRCLECSIGNSLLKENT